MDQLFSWVSGGFHGRKGQETGRDGYTPQQWVESLLEIFKTEVTRPIVVWMHHLLDFDSYFAPHMVKLSGFGASAEYTVDAARSSPPMMGRDRYSHLLVCEIRKAPGDDVATLRFAESMSLAEAGQYFPAKMGADGLVWCGDDQSGYVILRSLPEGSPQTLSYSYADWEYAEAFSDTLAKAEHKAGWPAGASAKWREWLSDLPSGTSALPWGPDVLLPACAPAPAPPPRLDTLRRRLAIDPLIGKRLVARTAAQQEKELDELDAFGADDVESFETPFADLELGDYAVAVAPSGKHLAPPFRLRTRGHDSAPLEFLQLVGTETRGQLKFVRAPPLLPSRQSDTAQVTWRYFESEWVDVEGERRLRFRPCSGDDGSDVMATSQYDKREMILVFHDGDAPTSAWYTLPSEQQLQLERIISRCVPRPTVCPTPADRRPSVTLRNHEEAAPAKPRGGGAHRKLGKKRAEADQDDDGVGEAKPAPRRARRN